MNHDPADRNHQPESDEPEDRELELPWGDDDDALPSGRATQAPASDAAPDVALPGPEPDSVTNVPLDATTSLPTLPTLPTLDVVAEPSHETDDDPPSDATEDLNAAISELEDALNERAPPETPLSSEDFDQLEQGEQYTIPMLDEVVRPVLDHDPEEPLLDYRAELQALSDGAGAYRPIFERLASELEVIVQAGVDEALKEASKRILRRVNEHIEIVLPEILDELARKQRDD